MTDSQKLLAEYVQSGSEAAFRELVTLYVDLVYTAALRLVEGDKHRAEDVAQTVFVDLARTARTLSSGVMLGGWLHRHTCFVAANTMRGERRRQSRERQAVEMNALQDHADANLSRVAPILDQVINELGEADRAAILLRFFEQRDFRSVGEALGSNEDAARMRVTRALEKLEALLKRHGVTSTATALSLLLSANAVQAAPVGLAITISAAAALAGTTIATTVTVTAAKTIAMTTLQKTLITAALTAAVGTGIYEARQASTLRSQNQTLQQQQAPPAEQIQQLTKDRDDATRQLAALRDDNERLNRNTAELLRLRSEVGRLRATSDPTPSDPTELAAKSWTARVGQLKRRLEQMPEAKIPEFQFLEEEDWLAAVKDRNLDTESEYRRALSTLRQAGESKFTSMLQPALSKYLKANKGQFPSDLSELQSYFESPVDNAVLQRYAILPASAVDNVKMGGEWIVTQKAAVDEEYDSRFVIGPNGYGSTSYKSTTPSKAEMDALSSVVKAYATANNGLEPTDLSQLQPYITTPEQQAALQKVIRLRNKQKSQ